jgi:hypothetical protein
MKLIFLSVLFSINAQAANWVRVDVFRDTGDIQNWITKEPCEEGGRHRCQDVPDMSVVKYDPASRLIEVDPAKVATQQAERAAINAKAQALAAAQERIEQVDWNRVTTIATLKAIVQDLKLLMENRK